jgi:hypothetical protein
VQGVFERETGNNLLRDSFVTHVYAGDVSDRLKHALAEHMGDRPRTAERVYNRMPGVGRRRPALELALQLALGLGYMASGAAGSGAAALGVVLEGSGMYSWASSNLATLLHLQQPEQTATVRRRRSSRWMTRTKRRGRSRRSTRVRPTTTGSTPCLRSTSSSSSSSTMPSHFRSDQPTSTAAVIPIRVPGLATTSAIETGGGAPHANALPCAARHPAAMEAEVPGPATFATARCVAVRDALPPDQHCQTYRSRR